MLSKNRKSVAITAATAFGAALVGVLALTNASAQAEGNPLVAVIVPELSDDARIGETAFNAKCAACHGANGAGNDQAGPPLIHIIYEPSHHGDAAFLLAAKNGVRSHHWRFGNMPPVNGITQAEVASIVTYIRAVQRANGID